MMFFEFGRLAGIEVEVKLWNLCELVDTIVMCSRKSELIKSYEIGSKILMLCKIDVEDVYFVVRLHDSDENKSELIALCRSLIDAERIFNTEKTWLATFEKEKGE